MGSLHRSLDGSALAGTLASQTSVCRTGRSAPCAPLVLEATTALTTHRSKCRQQKGLLLLGSLARAVLPAPHLREPYAIGMAGRKRSCFSESRHAIHTPLHRLVCRRKKECYGEHRAPRPPQAWLYGVQGPTMVYSRTVSQRQHRLALHGLRQDTAAHTGEVSPALWAGSNRGARLTAWTRAVDDGFTEWL
jgi:hypothetical protein